MAAAPNQSVVSHGCLAGNGLLPEIESLIQQDTLALQLEATNIYRMNSLSPVPANWVFDATRDPPVYTRRMVGSELAIQRHWDTLDADGQVCIGLTFTSSLGIEELKGRARRALDKLRFICPIIACTVEDVVSPRWVYTPSADREAWLDLAFAIEGRGASLNPSEFVQRINFKRLPYTGEHGATTLLRAYLLTTSKEGDDDSREYALYFHGTHAIIDGGPALHALNLMCEWMSGKGMDVEIEPLEEWKNLPVDPVTATGGPSPEWETAGTMLMQVFAEQSARTAPRITLAPPSRPLNMSDPPFLISKNVSEADTAAIVVATKKLGVSVSTLFHAAFCLAQFKMNPVLASTTEIDFSSDMTVVALDRYFKPPVNPRTHFISSFSLLPLRFSMTLPLEERSEKARLIATAKILQQRFNTYLANPCLPQLLAVMASMPPTGADQDNKAVDETAKQTEARDEPPTFPWTCAFNNLGVIENRLRTDHSALAVEHLSIGVRLRNYMCGDHAHVDDAFKVALSSLGGLFLEGAGFNDLAGATAWGEECIKTMLEETMRIGSLVLDAES